MAAPSMHDSRRPSRRNLVKAAHHLAPQNVLLVLDFCAPFRQARYPERFSDEQPLLRRPHQTVRTLGLRFLLRATAAEVKDL